VESSKEPSSSETPEDSPEWTEDEFVVESPGITYQFIDEEENEELEPSDPAGEQPLLKFSKLRYNPTEKTNYLQTRDRGCW
jgi:hypothetical protein